MKFETYHEKLKKKMDNKNGFTIIELVITIFILSFGVIGVFSAFSIITILTSDSVDRLTATYLAQEGMEIVRNIRDRNWLDMDAEGVGTWVDNNLNNCLSGCGVDYRSTATDSSKAGSYLWIDDNGFYDYDDTPGVSTKTKFQRKITITNIYDVAVIPPDDIPPKNDHIIKVIVEVSWDKKATVLNSGLQAGIGNCDPENCIKVEWMLYDWYYYRHR